MGRKKKVDTLPVEGTEVAVDNAAPVEESAFETPSEKPVEKKPAEKVFVESKGKFTLFRVGDGYVIMDNWNRLIGSGDDIEVGTRLLYGLAR